MIPVVLLVALAFVNFAFLWHLERKDRRFDDSISRLLQRIQAPGQAVYENTVVPADGASLPLSDEQLIELQEREAAVRRIEEMEMAAFGGNG